MTTTGLGDAKARRDKLIEAIETQHNDDACVECLAQLADYVDAQFAGQDYTVLFPAVAFHLDACTQCSGAYARFYDTEWAARMNALPALARIPEPDLSFLGGESMAERLQAAFRRVGGRLTLTLSPDLLPLLRPAPSAAALRAPQDTRRYGETLLALDPTPDLPIGLAAYRDAQQPDHCLVEVTVEPPDRAWPDLGGIEVALATRDREQFGLTDDWGLAAFEDVAVDDLNGLMVQVALA
ncbi:MAG: hypothetical protein U0822_26450 [Anaerolineae bacterium]